MTLYCHMQTNLTKILTEVRILAKIDQQRRDEIAHVTGLGRAAWQVLIIAKSGGTVPQIARKLGLSRQSVQRVADGLVESGLAHYESNPDHQRSPLLPLTNAGESTLARLEQLAESYEPDFEETLEAEEIETTLHVLRALRASL